MQKKIFDIEDHEKEILEDLEKDAFVSISNAPKEIRLAKETANNFIRQNTAQNLTSLERDR